ncbi:MAG: GTPase ObgE [Bdellovibrionales bacterium]|jgi:GTP-binding protein|nr:GTPase ObgE [Bdellovibrionales bacterium]
MKFIDEIHIKVSSGHGGPGAISFRRESGTPRGGPDGGDGGKGGNLVLRTSKHLNSLVDLRANKHYAAQDGYPGTSANSSGAQGQDLVILVPEGTLVRNLEGEVIVDLTNSHDFVLLAGGRGGKGNAFFKTSVNQAPEKAQPGEDGSSMEIKLELKLIADVGIIGFPNAGKSTLISRISAARPKIADYPFTTLTPNLGVVKAAEFKSFVVADIPGLVKGAHEGIGLGIQFLRHIERTRLFIHLIDVSGISGRDPFQDYLDINFELEKYDDTNKEKEGFFPLAPREQFVVLNKIDSVQSDDLSRLKAQFKKKLGVEPYLISAVSGKNIKELIQAISKKIFTEDLP